MIKKYEMLDEFKVHMGKKLYRIVALKDIERYGVKAGDLGGWIEKEENLSHLGDCWVGGNAKVYGDAKVCSNAFVFDNADVCDNALITGQAKVFENAAIRKYARIFDNAQVYGNAVISGIANIFGEAWIYDNVYIGDTASVEKTDDYIYFNGLGETKRGLTAFKNEDKDIIIHYDSALYGFEDFKNKAENLADTKQKDVLLKFAELAEIYFKREVNDNE